MKGNYFRQWGSSTHRSGIAKEECLDAESLEYIILTSQRNRALYNQFKKHIGLCEDCINRIQVLETYYKVLDRELHRPASPQLVQFAESLMKPID